MLEDLDWVIDAKGRRPPPPEDRRRSRRRRRRRAKRQGHDKPDATVIPPAFLLTPDVAEELADGLDASDVLECYWLTRRVFLQGVANQTISVSKTALGLRYRPPPWAAYGEDETARHRREMVLEYGPDRAGTKNENDVLPVLIPSDADGDGTAETVYVSWHNEGRVFYSQEIHALQYESATYMASVTGAVVVDVLQRAARYPSERGSRRYQPWEVMLVHDNDDDDAGKTDNNHNDNEQQQGEETATLRLRSSGDVDFVTDMMRHLATLGVDLLPVLRPTVYALEITVRAVSRETITPAARARMGLFYQRLYACVDQLAGGRPATRTHAAVETVPPAPAFGPTSTSGSTTTTLTPTPGGPAGIDRNFNATLVPTYDLGFTTPTTTGPTIAPDSNRRILQGTVDNNNNDFNDTTTTSTPTPQVRTTTAPTHVPTWRTTPEPSFVVPPSPADPPPSSSAADAQKAAEEAHKAAQNATDMESAVDAAQQAVDAAQQAVDATVSQEAVLRREALLSGNAEEMTLTAALCFSDPLYGIRTNATSSSTTAYLYWDATYYFSLELVHPYVRVVPKTWTAPTPVQQKVSAFSPDSNLVDWSLAFVYVGLAVLGVLLLMQRVSPSSARRSQWLYKAQRWFFDPMHHNYDVTENDDVQRASESRPLGQERIPYSMGGGDQHRRPSPLYVGGDFRRTRAQSKDGLFKHSSYHSSSAGSNGAMGGGGAAGGIDEAAAPGDVEMVSQNNNNNKTTGSFHGDSMSDLGEEEFMDEAASTASHRLFRDPELVELPDLTSSSKVAVPVSLKRSNSDNFSID